MKKMKEFLFLSFVAIFITACGPDEVPEVKKELKLDKYEVTVVEGEKHLVNVTQSNGDVSATSSDKGIVTATVNDKVIIVKGVKEGKADITVKDKKNTKVIKVTVIGEDTPPPPPPADQDLQVDPEKAQGMTIFTNRNPAFIKIVSGSGNYTAELKDPSYGTVKIKDTADKDGTIYYVYITPTKEGKTTLVINDTKTKEKVEVPITIKIGLLITPSTQQTISIGETKEFTLTGYGQYTTKDFNGAQYVNIEFKGNKLLVTGKAVGTAGFNVVDSETERFKPVSIIVINKRTLLLAYNSTNLNVGGQQHKVAIESHSENPSYAIKNSNSSVAKAEVEGEELVITPLAAGQAIITLTDNGFSTPQSVEFTVNVQGADDIKITSNGTVIDLNGKTGDIVLPAGAKKIPAYNSGSKPFAKKAGITSIDFQNVTSIQTYALYLMPDLTTVHLRKIEVLGQGAFLKCSKLSKVYCYMENPSNVQFQYDKHFEGISSSAVLYVPKGKVNAYKSTKFGEYFSNIQEM